MHRCRIESMGVSLPGRRLVPRGSLKHAAFAGRQCLKASSYHPGDVHLLINSGIHRDEHICEPAMAVYIQHKLGINTEFQGQRTLSFDLQNGGCGMLNAVEALCALMQSGSMRAGMVVASEANSDRRPDPAYPYPSSGVALLLDLCPLGEIGFGRFAFHTREALAQAYSSIVDLKVKRGQIRFQRQESIEDVYLSMSMELIDDVLAQNHLQRRDINRFIPAQISPRFLRELPHSGAFPQEKMADYSLHMPDTLSTSLFLALQHSITLQPPQKGEKVLLMAFGSGVTAGAGVYQF